MKGLLIDVTKCIGCGACTAACKQANKLADAPGDDLATERYTVVRQVDVGEKSRRNVRRLCLHCLEPTCQSVCPVGALHKTAEGPVVYEVDRCIGCRYCVMACPHGVPRYEWHALAPRVRKCILCAPRLAEGKATACSEACPMGATTFGDRDELFGEARRRIRESPKMYLDAIYGEKEGGGSSVLYLADVDFGALGLPANIPLHPLGDATDAVMGHLPDVVLIAGSLLFGLQWIIHRRDLLVEERLEAREEVGAEAKEEAKR